MLVGWRNFKCAGLVTSQRIGPWTSYKRNEESIAQFQRELGALI
jgi:hypothetical protein